MQETSLFARGGSRSFRRGVAMTRGRNVDDYGILYFSALELRLHILCLSEHTPVMSISNKSHNPCCTCNAHMVITLCGDFMRNTTVVWL